jgi:hypothetical protein
MCVCVGGCGCGCGCVWLEEGWLGFTFHLWSLYMLYFHSILEVTSSAGSTAYYSVDQALSYLPISS